MKKLVKKRLADAMASEVLLLFAYIDTHTDEQLAVLSNEQLVDNYMRDRWRFRFERQKRRRRLSAPPCAASTSAKPSLELSKR